MRKDKITVEELKETLTIAQTKVLEKYSQKFKETVEKKKNEVSPLSEMLFNMQNMMAMTEFEQAILEELGINE